MFQVVNIPNVLSFLRILCTPLFIWFLFKGGAFFFGAIVIFTIAALTDLCDGYLARRYGLVTDIGNFLDPVADKIFMFGTFFSLQLMQIVPIWFVVILIFRDLLLTCIRLIMIHQGKPLVTSKLGKWKTGAQFLMIYIIFFYLLCRECCSSVFFIKKMNLVVQSCLYVVTGFILISALEYLVKNRKQLFDLR